MAEEKTGEMLDLFSEVDSFLEQKKLKETTSFKDDLLCDAKDKWTNARTNVIVSGVAKEFSEIKEEVKEEKIDKEEAISELEKMIGSTSIGVLLDALKDKEVPVEKTKNETTVSPEPEVEEVVVEPEAVETVEETETIPEVKEEVTVSIDPEIAHLKEESLPEEFDASKEIVIFKKEPVVVENKPEEPVSDFVSMFVDDVYEDDETLDDISEEETVLAETVEETASEEVETTEEVQPAVEEFIPEIVVEEVIEEKTEEPVVVIEPEEVTVEEQKTEKEVKQDKEEVVVELEKPRDDDDFIVVPKFIENKKSVEQVIEENIAEYTKETAVVEEKTEEPVKEEPKETKVSEPVKKKTQSVKHKKTQTKKKPVKKKKHEPKKEIPLWVYVAILVALTAVIVGIVVVQFIKAREQAALLDVYYESAMIIFNQLRTNI